jgi:hypothetical protein
LRNIATFNWLVASTLEMAKKIKTRRLATTSLYLIESREAERKLREARQKRRTHNDNSFKIPKAFYLN